MQRTGQTDALTPPAFTRQSSTFHGHRLPARRLKTPGRKAPETKKDLSGERGKSLNWRDFIMRRRMPLRAPQAAKAALLILHRTLQKQKAPGILRLSWG
jgi:hypothetical protein